MISCNIKQLGAYNPLGDFFKEKALNDKTNMSLTVSKAEQTYGDIDSGLDFAQMRQGVIDQPIRTPKIRSLFPVTPVSTEFFKYVAVVFSGLHVIFKKFQSIQGLPGPAIGSIFVGQGLIAIDDPQQLADV